MLLPQGFWGELEWGLQGLQLMAEKVLLCSPQMQSFHLCRVQALLAEWDFLVSLNLQFIFISVGEA